MLPVLEIRHVTKVFKDFWMRPRVIAVDDLSLTLNRGEVFGLLGPNGSGKSTTIKMILGLLHPTKGQIAVLGMPPSDVSLKSRIGYLPEESFLYRFLNARETLEFYARLFKIDPLEREKRIDMLIDMVGLTGAQYRPVSEYSKGMQRRIGLAQALINDPDFLILDEPTTGLDPIGTRQIKDLILTLKSRGKTVLLCSHLLNEVEDVCDRVCVFYGGKIQAQGTVDSLLTVSEKHAIHTPQLKETTLARVRQVIAEEEGNLAVDVQRPRQTLEHLFLDLVEKAQLAGQKTSGATNVGKVADFLTQPEQGAALLESLTRKSEPVVAEPVAVAEPVQQPDAGVLSALSGEPESVTKSAQSAPTPSSSASTGASPTAPNATPSPPVNADRDLLCSLTRKSDQP
jgi:ABC-2 type transport system ATP-binding protein